MSLFRECPSGRTRIGDPTPKFEGPRVPVFVWVHGVRFQVGWTKAPADAEAPTDAPPQSGRKRKGVK